MSGSQENEGLEPREPNGAFEGALRALSEVIDGIVAQTCARHYPELTEEPELTAVLADKLETELRNFRFGDLGVHVQVQTFPSHRPDALEKKVGADLYISTIVHDGRSIVSKGILAQAKWDDTVHRDKKLDEQTAKMTARSPQGSYVWVYEPRGIEVVPAQAMSQVPRPSAPPGQGTVGELIASSIRCNAGDRGIGRRVEGEYVEPLSSAMERIGAAVGVGFMVSRIL